VSKSVDIKNCTKIKSIGTCIKREREIYTEREREEERKKERRTRQKNKPSLLSLHLNVIFADASPTKNSFCCCFTAVVVEGSSFSSADEFTSTSARKYASPIHPGRKSDILVGWTSVAVVVVEASRCSRRRGAVILFARARSIAQCFSSQVKTRVLEKGNFSPTNIFRVSIFYFFVVEKRRRRRLSSKKKKERHHAQGVTTRAPRQSDDCDDDDFLLVFATSVDVHAREEEEDVLLFSSSFSHRTCLSSRFIVARDDVFFIFVVVVVDKNVRLETFVRRRVPAVRQRGGLFEV
jgi:hypothetical protein